MLPIISPIENASAVCCVGLVVGVVMCVVVVFEKPHSRYKKPGKLKFFARDDSQCSWDTWNAEALAMIRIMSIS